LDAHRGGQRHAGVGEVGRAAGHLDPGPSGAARREEDLRQPVGQAVLVPVAEPERAERAPAGVDPADAARGRERAQLSPGGIVDAHEVVGRRGRGAEGAHVDGIRARPSPLESPSPEQEQRLPSGGGLAPAAGGRAAGRGRGRARGGSGGCAATRGRARRCGRRRTRSRCGAPTRGRGRRTAGGGGRRCRARGRRGGRRDLRGQRQLVGAGALDPTADVVRDREGVYQAGIEACYEETHRSIGGRCGLPRILRRAIDSAGHPRVDAIADDTRVAARLPPYLRRIRRRPGGPDPQHGDQPSDLPRFQEHRGESRRCAKKHRIR